jgi:hypothetical protein
MIVTTVLGYFVKGVSALARLHFWERSSFMHVPNREQRTVADGDAKLSRNKIAAICVQNRNGPCMRRAIPTFIAEHRYNHNRRGFGVRSLTRPQWLT